VVVIPNWVDADAYDLPRKDPHQPPVSCLYLGWMENHKGIHELLEVISEEREAFADVQFKFAGGGGELQAFADRVRALGLGGRVDCLGWVDSQAKARLLAEADVFVSFSYVEGMPNALLEAAAAGCACIATRAGASDSIIPDRRYGILVEPGDRQALGCAMKFVFSNPASRISMGTSARERVLKLYTVSAAADSFYRVFLDVARR
jgi:glycosyltransferase involved in cell wall biosynthesis